MLLRTIVPLLLLLSNDRKVIFGRTRFQKLIFLAQRTESAEKWYSFIPYNFGPYSVELQQDLDNLISQGYITETEVITKDNRTSYEYACTETGENFFNIIKSTSPNIRKIDSTLSTFKYINEKFGTLELDKLIRLVYFMYPEYAGKSVYHS